MNASPRVVCLLLVGALACGKKGNGNGAQKRGQGPVPVRVSTAARMDAPVTITASGVVEPMQTVAITAQVMGALHDVLFQEGQFVQKGQVLFRIDPRPLQAAADQARATLLRDRAQAEAAVANDKRYRVLAEQDYVAREQAEQVHATALAQAAIVRADEAALRAADVNLAYATLRAPIAGRTGGLLVRNGNVVGPTTGPLVVINQLQPILVRFPVLSQDLPLLQRALATRPLEVTATRADSGNVTERGALSFLDNAVDSLTGTVTGKAVLQNHGNRFWPGQLVALSVSVGVQRNVLAVPATAVLTGQQGSYVYVVDAQRKTATTRNVNSGRTVGDFTIVDSGLREGEQVVTDGQSRLSPGSRVAIIGPGRDTARSAPLSPATAAVGSDTNGVTNSLDGEVVPARAPPVPVRP